MTQDRVAMSSVADYLAVRLQGQLAAPVRHVR